MRCRLVLGLAVVLAACSDDSGSGGATPIPNVPWGSFRHDILNSGAGNVINTNKGEVTQLCSTDPDPGSAMASCKGFITESTPAIDRNFNVALGIGKGVVSFNGTAFCSGNESRECTGDSCRPYGSECDPDTKLCMNGMGPNPCKTDSCGDDGLCTGKCRWTFPSGEEQCSIDDSDMAVGTVRTSPAITPGNAIVFGTATDGEPGRIFAIKEVRTETELLWVFPRNTRDDLPAFLSSPAPIFSTFDLTLNTVVAAGGDGILRVLNFDGSERWTFSRAGDARPITSSPALEVITDLTGTQVLNTVYVTTPDGVLSAIDSTGRLLWQFGLGIPPEATLAPSPAVGTSVYAVGASGALFAVTAASLPDPKWVFTPQNPITGRVPLSGSPAYQVSIFGQGSTNVTDSIVYVVDVDGWVYGVRDGTGQVVQLQRCSGADPEDDVDCRLDSCTPFNATCDQQTNRCFEKVGPDEPCTSESCMPFGATCDQQTMRCMVMVGPDQACTRDSCQPDLGFCVPTNGSTGLVGRNATVPVSTSLVVSADTFAVVGTDDGRLCATTLNDLKPGQDLDPPTAAWASGCIVLGDAPVRSSPAIGRNGEIYVTTEDGLFLIK